MLASGRRSVQKAWPRRQDEPHDQPISSSLLSSVSPKRFRTAGPRALVDFIQAFCDFGRFRVRTGFAVPVAFNDERAEFSTSSHPHRLRQAKFLPPMHILDAHDATAQQGAGAIADSRQVDGTIGHEMLFVILRLSCRPCRGSAWRRTCASHFANPFGEAERCGRGDRAHVEEPSSPIDPLRREQWKLAPLSCGRSIGNAVALPSSARIYDAFARRVHQCRPGTRRHPSSANSSASLVGFGIQADFLVNFPASAIPTVSRR